MLNLCYNTNKKVLNHWKAAFPMLVGCRSANGLFRNCELLGGSRQTMDFGMSFRFIIFL